MLYLILQRDKKLAIEKERLEILYKLCVRSVAMILQYLPIATINIADDSFRMTFAPNLTKLKNSIKKIGVSQPIVVRHTEDGAYQIVSGYKRVRACQELGRQTIPALIHEHTDLSPVQAFIRNLNENAFTRELNIIEKGTALSKLREYYAINEEDLVNTYLPLLNEDPSYKLLHQYLTISLIIEPMKQHIIDAGIALTSAARISEFSPTTQSELLKVLQPIRPNTNKLNELLTLIREIAARDGTTVETILQRYQLLRIVTDQNVAQPERIAALRQTLHGVRMPQLAKKRAEFETLLQDLELPNSVKLHADPLFENSKMKLEYQFNNPQQLNSLIKHLEKAFEKHAWDRIFDWYSN